MASHYRSTTKHDSNEQITESKVLKATDLDIAWGGDERYWRWIPRGKITGESNSTETVAELLQVSWLEVSARVPAKMFLPSTKYEVTFHIIWKPDAFGWKDVEVYVVVWFKNKEPVDYVQVDLQKSKEQTVPLELGSVSFTTPANLEDDMIFGLYEVWSQQWKGGLVILGAKITKSQDSKSS
ncbi:protein PHLOEM PROTEIN 2-LIKE A9 [Amborella trichopoda]|uniref:Uncharacterized protein n=1 Tax=Amborella trichopoda TaxID=13333 RepID=U5D088_AMBTC|nr:protein PHLOEM PROTEIN 2-LIKE A9 [Amborella trichopoda]ERN14807.1 hypothetical protein AMTR_s00032p00089190 [Amborella trichopoda]|eukprot:XP_006853340.1 protein PHLOEM PROTEIN 2-LIKE A9 [Amborella trichopoda]